MTTAKGFADFVCLFLVPMHEYMEAFKYFRYFESFLLAIFSMRLCYLHGHHFKCLHKLSLKWLIIISMLFHVEVAFNLSLLIQKAAMKVFLYQTCCGSWALHFCLVGPCEFPALVMPHLLCHRIYMS